ncbi:hypothetical protein IG631_07427 [Alternaria alternata]|jgi:hypothetical protein|nr:hypothetical protein IG631_07427 [Alternaria alternata]
MCLGRQSRTNDGTPVVCDYNCLFALLQKLLSDADNELAQRFEYFVRAVCGQTIGAAVARKIDGYQDGVLL